MKKIPKKFQIGSYTIKVVMLDVATFEKKVSPDAYGMFDPNTLTIYLCKSPPELKGAEQHVFQCFWHEYCHALLFVVWPKLYANEKLVDAMGHSLAQLMRTSTFGQSSKKPKKVATK